MVEQCDCLNFSACVDIVDARHRQLGQLEARYGRIIWTSFAAGETFSMTAEEFDHFMQMRCPAGCRTAMTGRLYREYVPLQGELDLLSGQMDASQLTSLRRMNARLAAIEADIVREVRPQVARLERRVADSQDWLQDFGCSVNLRFSAGRDDPCFDEDSENIVIDYELDYSMIEYFYGRRINDGVNWNEFAYCNGHPLQDEVHCWLYHDLYDHHHLGWVNILRINEVSIDVKFRYQHRPAQCLV